jgi:hypothetical protein
MFSSERHNKMAAVPVSELNNLLEYFDAGYGRSLLHFTKTSGIAERSA